jgi:hypothetical protein
MLEKGMKVLWENVAENSALEIYGGRRFLLCAMKR